MKQLEEARQVNAEFAREGFKLAAKAASCLSDAFLAGNQLLICGNGGSAADAQHIAAEFVGRYLRERRPLPAQALTTNTSSLTAIGNDYSYSTIFERQVQAFGRKGDVLIGISTSGNSENVLKAFAAAKKIGMKTIGFTGLTGGKMPESSDILVRVPSTSTPRIQEMHICIAHIICDLVEQSICETT